MAEIRLQTPDPFNFRDPDDWPGWKRRFQQFRVASSLATADAKKQVSTFLYCLGEEAESVLASTNATEEDRADYDRVVAKFDDFFKVRKNVIYERARFNRRNQQSGESAEQYIMVLYNLAENCDYGDIKEEMIRDRLVVGIRDTALSAKMQMDSTLMLETAKKSIHQREAVHEQQQALKGASERAPSNLETIRPQPNSTDRRNRREQRSSRDFGRYRSTPTTKGREKQCSRCGRGQHPRDKCPAKEAKCHKCQRKGHYSSQCYSKMVSTLEDDRTLDTAFLDTVSSRQDNAWYTTASINGKR